MDDDKRQRLIDAAKALLANVPKRELPIVVLNKALFYLDLACLRDVGEALTQNTFVALPLGPVVAKYDKRLVATLVNAGVASQRAEGLSKPLRLLDTVDTPRFQSEIDKLVVTIAKWSSTLSASAASDISHANPGWLLARAEGGHKQPKPINMYIAMQQILDDDPWLSEPISDTLIAQADLPGIPW